MAKIRMTEGQRYKLRNLAETLVKPVAQFNALQKAYDKAAPRVRKTVEARYPVKDMEVCKKYHAASVDDCIKLQLTAGGVDRFEFAEGTGPLTVRDCQVYLADEPTTNAFTAWVYARDAYEKERLARVADYTAVIRAAKYVEEIITVWPEVAAHVPQRAELVAVNDEVIERIKADQRERSKAA